MKVLPFQKNIKFHCFPDLFRYQFWHWFLMSFGMDFTSFWGNLLAWLFMFLGDWFLMFLFDGIFIDLWPKWLQNLIPRTHLFVTFPILFWRRWFMLILRWFTGECRDPGPFWYYFERFWHPFLINVREMLHKILPFGTRICKVPADNRRHPRRKNSTLHFHLTRPHAEHCRRHLQP
jgi:hypothetical protein